MKILKNRKRKLNTNLQDLIQNIGQTLTKFEI